MNKNLKPLSLGELTMLMARLELNLAQLNREPVYHAKHQGLLLDKTSETPVKTQVKTRVEQFSWPTGKLVPGQKFQYTKVQGRSAGKTFWYIVGADGKAHKDPSQFVK